jgi:RNA polymerase-associated protein LEO1
MVSNTNIYRWSDGSVTLAVGDDHYEIETKSLAPPSNEPYQEIRDAHYYAAAAHLSSNCLLIVGHLTEEYSVRPNKDVQDDALEKLHRKMAEAAKSNVANIIIQTTEDPELKRKQAELAEKERNKAQRRRETAAARMEGSGRYARGGALSIGDLEGGRRGAGGAAAGRKRGAAGGAQSRKRNRNAEYDSDDDLPGGAGRHDEYVLDDFAVASDEEASEGEDDEEEEILDDDEDEEEEEAPRRKRQRTAEKEVGDEDAEGEVDDDAAPAPVQETASRRRGRRVVEDDDDE